MNNVAKMYDGMLDALMAKPPIKTITIYLNNDYGEYESWGGFKRSVEKYYSRGGAKQFSIESFEISVEKYNINKPLGWYNAFYLESDSKNPIHKAKIDGLQAFCDNLYDIYVRKEGRCDE